MRRSAGFTLLELLIAVSIFALMSTMAYSGLRSVLHARQITDAQAEALRDLQWTEMLLGRDLRSAIARPVRDDFGDEQPALVGDELGSMRLQLTRGGWPNPLEQPRSELQRVGWGVEEGRLVRYYWPMLDRAAGSEAYKVELLGGVSDFQLRYLDEAGEWHTQWPDIASTVLPRAVEVTLVSERFGPLRRLYPLDAGGR